MIVGLDDRPDVVAVVPTLGRENGRLNRCIDSLRASTTSRRLAVLCVVNSPWPELPDVDLADVAVEVTGLNLGWAGGLQFARQFTGDALIWLVQDDMVVGPTTLDHLAIALDADHMLGVVGPIVVGPDGKVPAGSCGGRISPDGAIETWWPHEDCERDQLTGLDDLSYLPSRGMLVRASAWDAVGGMDPLLYPVQYVDVDFSFAIRASGLRHALVPVAMVGHAAGSSTAPGFGEFVQIRNAERFLQKWFPLSSRRQKLASLSAPLRPSPVEALGSDLHPSMPHPLLAAVAQSASDTLLHLAGAYANEREASRSFEADLAAAHHHAEVIEALLSDEQAARRGAQRQLADAQTQIADLAARTTEAAARSAARSRTVADELAALKDRGDRMAAQNAELVVQHQEAQARSTAIEHAWFWRVTAPIRRIADMVKRR